MVVMKGESSYGWIDSKNRKKIELYNFIEQTNRIGVKVIKVCWMHVWDGSYLDNGMIKLKINLGNYFYGFELLRELDFQIMWNIEGWNVFDNPFCTDVFYKYVRNQDALYLKDTTDRCYDFAFEIIRKINFSQIRMDLQDDRGQAERRLRCSRMDSVQPGITRIQDERPELLCEAAKLYEITWI